MPRRRALLPPARRADRHRRRAARHECVAGGRRVAASAYLTMMRYPIRVQVLIPMVAVLSAVIISLSVLSASLASSWIDREIERQVEGVRETMAQRRFPLTDRVLQQMAGLSRAEYALVDSKGELVASSDDRLRRLSARQWRRMASDSTETERVLPQSSVAYYHRQFAVADAQGSGAMVLHVFLSSSAYRAAWRRAVLPPLIVGAVALLLAAVASRYVARRVTAPLATLQRHLSRVAQGDFRPIDVPLRRDEIRDLVASINHMTVMLGRFEQEVRRRERLETLARLGSSMAHQIRNAATGCRMAIDLHAESHGGGMNDEELEQAREQLKRIEEFLRQFLELGKRIADDRRGEGEPGGGQPLFDGFGEREPVERVIESAVRQTDAVARHLGVRVEVDVASEAEGAEVPRTAVEQALVNLLRNGVEAAAADAVQRHAPLSGGGERGVCATVRVACRVADEMLVLDVWDSGAGPSPEVSSRMYEPFMSDKAGGAGLGLSLVESVAASIGGQVSWCRSNGRTCFTLSVPLAAVGDGEEV